MKPPAGFSSFMCNRASRGGGIMAIFKENINIKQISNTKYFFKSFEMLRTTITFPVENKTYQLFCIYRPPASQKNKIKKTDFLPEFESFLQDIYTKTENCIILGDLNVHVDDTSDSEAKAFLETLKALNLTQHVTEPTHIGGHTLDLVISKENDRNISCVSVGDCPFGDHSYVSTELQFSNLGPVRKILKYRNTKHFDVERFDQEVKLDGLESRLMVSSDVNDMVEDYNNTLKNILNKQCPLITKEIILRPHTEWYTDVIRTLKHQLRKAENTWRKSKLHVHKQIYQKLKNERNAAIQNSRKNYIKEKIISQKDNPKELYKTINGLMTHDENQHLPLHSNSTELANRFMSFFDNKITDIRSSLDVDMLAPASQNQENRPLSDDVEERPHLLNRSCGSGMADFIPASQEEVDTLVRQSPNKTCSLDPVPTWIIKKCSRIFVPILTLIVNASLSTGSVPPNLKQAIITPLIKQPSLDKDCLKNYRPVSNLSFLSKLIERIISKRLHMYLSLNSFFSKFQSAYRQNHSTETALTRIYNDIVEYLDKGNSVVLILLDLSAAFDTIDQHMLLDRLKSYFKLSGNVLNWFKSYLTERTQSVIINNFNMSETNVLRFGVPQGSVLGPLLYTLYTKPLCDLIESFDIDFHMYADDTQLYCPFNKNNLINVIENAENCVKAVKHWMTLNKLKINDDKTEIIQISKKSSKSCGKPIIKSFNLPSTTVIPATASIKNLGVLFDERLDMNDHITKQIQNCNFFLLAISKIRMFLDKETTNMLVCSLILSRLDYCNSMLIGLPSNVLERLQKVQNKAARITSLSKARDHITPVLKNLHWLPISKRIEYKVLCYIYKCLNESAPSYLQELISQYKPSRELRSSEANLLNVRKKKRQCLAEKVLHALVQFCGIVFLLKLKLHHRMTFLRKTLRLNSLINILGNDY